MGVSGIVNAAERLSAAELAAQADAICADAAEQLNPLFAELFPTGSETPPADEAAPIMAQAADAITAEIRALTALKPPQQLQADWLQLERLLRRIDHEVRWSAQLAARGDTDGYLQVLQGANELDAESREIFAAIGATTCSGEA